jgi:hypothetical protein
MRFEDGQRDWLGSYRTVQFFEGRRSLTDDKVELRLMPMGMPNFELRG